MEGPRGVSALFTNDDMVVRFGFAYPAEVVRAMGVIRNLSAIRKTEEAADDVLFAAIALRH